MENDNPCNVNDPVPIPALPVKFFKLPEFLAVISLGLVWDCRKPVCAEGSHFRGDKFGLVTGVLPELSARKISHRRLHWLIVTRFLQLLCFCQSAYGQLDMQSMEALFNMDYIGNKKPMDLLSEILELLMLGEEITEIFAMLRR